MPAITPIPTSKDRVTRAAGWAAVLASATIAGAWAAWGTTEALHDGRYPPAAGDDLATAAMNYLVPALLVVAAGLIGIRWPRPGGGAHAALAAGTAWFVRGAAPRVVVLDLVLPLLLLGTAYVVGRPTPRGLAVAVLAGVPLLAAAAATSGPAWRIAHRFDDGYRGSRRIAANGIDLVWAPAGPGWPRHGVTWHEAVEICRRLNADGTALADTPLDLWRLPTVEEAVRAQCRGGANAQGAWDSALGRPYYAAVPDKESPLWDPTSKVVYWWTATSIDETNAYIIVYDGKVWPRRKSARWGYLGFRAVREPSPSGG